MYKKKSYLVTVLAVLAVLTLAACEKKLQPITGLVSISPAPTSTSTPTPTPITKVEVNKDTVDIKLIESAEGVSTIKLSVKTPIKFADGSSFDTNKLYSAIMHELWNEYAASLYFRSPEELRGFSRLCGDNAVLGIKKGIYRVSDDEMNEVLTKYNEMVTDANVHKDETVKYSYEKAVKEAWEEAVKAIIYNCLTNFSEYADQGYMGAYTKADLSNEKLQVAYTMCMWGFGEFEESSKVFLNTRGKRFDTAAGEYPELEDFVEEVQYLYSNDKKDFYEKEVAGSDKVSLLEREENLFVFNYIMTQKMLSSQSDEFVIEGVKCEDTSVLVQLTGELPEDLYSLFDISVEIEF